MRAHAFSALDGSPEPAGGPPGYAGDLIAVLSHATPRRGEIHGTVQTVPADSPSADPAFAWTVSPASGRTDRPAVALASTAGLGLCPLAPGTAASLAVVLLLWLLPFSTLARGGTLLGVTLGGIRAGERGERLAGRKDPRVIVSDEVAETMLSVLGPPPSP